MQTKHINMIAPSHCKYRWHGRNLAEIRRGGKKGLRHIARALKVNDDCSKNEMLGLIIAKLNTMGAETELSEMVAPAKKKVAKTKKKASKK